MKVIGSKLIMLGERKKKKKAASLVMKGIQRFKTYSAQNRTKGDESILSMSKGRRSLKGSEIGGYFSQESLG
jgi:hypothetical protein